MKKFKKILLYTTGLVLFGILMWNFFPWDDRSVNDADLTLRPAGVIEAEDNIYLNLPDKTTFSDDEKTAYELVTAGQSYEDFVVAIERSDLTTADFMSSTQDIVQQFEQAVAKGSYQCPLAPNALQSLNNADEANQNCDFIHTGKLATVAIHHAMYRAQLGDYQSATRLTQSVFDLGTAILSQDGDITLVEYLVAVSIFNRVLDLHKDQPTINLPDLTTLTEGHLLVEKLISTYRSEYQYAKLLVRDGLGERVTYWQQPNQTVNNLAEFMRANIAVARSQCGSYESAQLMQANADSIAEYRDGVSDLQGLLGQNLKGRLFTSLLTTVLHSTFIKQCELKDLLVDVQL